MSEEEIVCKKPEYEAKCKVKCLTELSAYNACAERIKNDTTGEAHCTGQYFDFWHCTDKCAANAVFSSLK
ncbi:hypothetical protein BSKO_03443 [Bryopsis sp. KO-2023]|nr:hypothetical protein BSKO_03443 [Bryopsis sp. KO-2023]